MAPDLRIDDMGQRIEDKDVGNETDRIPCGIPSRGGRHRQTSQA